MNFKLGLFEKQLSYSDEIFKDFRNLTNCNEHAIKYFSSKNVLKYFLVFQLLNGNKDSHTVKVSYLEHPVTARFLRLHVQAWYNHPSLKMDIIGCQSRLFIIRQDLWIQGWDRVKFDFSEWKTEMVNMISTHHQSLTTSQSYIAVSRNWQRQNFAG